MMCGGEGFGVRDAAPPPPNAKHRSLEVHGRYRDKAKGRAYARPHGLVRFYELARTYFQKNN